MTRKLTAIFQVAALLLSLSPAAWAQTKGPTALPAGEMPVGGGLGTTATSASGAGTSVSLNLSQPTTLSLSGAPIASQPVPTAQPPAQVQASPVAARTPEQRAGLASRLAQRAKAHFQRAIGLSQPANDPAASPAPGD